LLETFLGEALEFTLARRVDFLIFVLSIGEIVIVFVFVVWSALVAAWLALWGDPLEFVLNGVEIVIVSIVIVVLPLVVSFGLDFCETFGRGDALG
jgi:hypothetical protein